ncbi:MAG TPA: hypothetical protein VMT00_04730 [Thermoanaerobaculia bacterium]|nr:hypothetical protein [Thermoanaerobaculia bacterium]
MNWLIAAALFVAGVYLAIRALAALHRIIDLWFTIDTAWPMVLRGLIIWCGGTAALALVLPEHHARALLYGIAAFVAFYLAGFVLWRLLVPRLASRRVRATARPS